MYHVRQRDDASIIEVNGALDASSSRALASAIALAELTLDFPVVVSLAGCRRCDSTGLRILVSAHNRLGDRFFIIVPAANRLNNVFDATGLTKHLPIRGSLDEALDRPRPRTSSDLKPARRPPPRNKRNTIFGPPPRRPHSNLPRIEKLSCLTGHADVLLMVRTLAANGSSLREIVAKLDAGGHRTLLGDRWCAVQVSRVLSRFYEF